tara:strand:- start:814 stop:1446 length:633 start_codon:yes stop_codon:yes gene_type:complete
LISRSHSAALNNSSGAPNDIYLAVRRDSSSLPIEEIRIVLPNLGESLPEGEEWSLLTDMLSPRSGGGGGRSANLNEGVPESAPGNVVQPVFLAVKRLTAARAAAPSAIALTEVKVREDIPFPFTYRFFYAHEMTAPFSMIKGNVAGEGQAARQVFKASSDNVGDAARSQHWRHHTRRAEASPLLPQRHPPRTARCPRRERHVHLRHARHG